MVCKFSASLVFCGCVSVPIYRSNYVFYSQIHSHSIQFFSFFFISIVFFSRPLNRNWFHVWVVSLHCAAFSTFRRDIFFLLTKVDKNHRLAHIFLRLKTIFSRCLFVYFWFPHRNCGRTRTLKPYKSSYMAEISMWNCSIVYLWLGNVLISWSKNRQARQAEEHKSKQTSRNVRWFVSWIRLSLT